MNGQIHNLSVQFLLKHHVIFIYKVQRVLTHVINEHVFQPRTKENVCIRIQFNSPRIVGDNNTAAVPMFRDTNMAAVTLRENTL